MVMAELNSCNSVQSKIYLLHIKQNAYSVQSKIYLLSGPLTEKVCTDPCYKRKIKSPKIGFQNCILCARTHESLGGCTAKGDLGTILALNALSSYPTAGHGKNSLWY